ncbi:MAG: chromosome segregation protein SMC [Polyangiaceae bacterium]
MHIKKLEICGFKSFVDRTVIHFDHDVIGIVGPNGCGKSNIVDAIRWSMGEQSAKHLRGRAMSDVIFAGSQSRGPHGMAEVTLTFDNTDREAALTLPLEYRDYAEIAVTRRLYRDGTSEYEINKTQVRLKDVTDLFLGTGVGTKAYSIIEQGKIGLIVSARAEDRRMLIEEAAGITKYKARRKQAEQKMDLTRQNLLRVGDIVSEIERNLASLKRQAAKAERYVNYKRELEDLVLHEASHKLLELTVRSQVAEAGREAMAEEEQRTRAALDTEDAELDARRLAALEHEEAAEKAQADAYRRDNEVRAHEAELERAREKYRVHTDRGDEARMEIDDLEARLGELLREREGLLEALAQAEEGEAAEAERMQIEAEKLDEISETERTANAAAQAVRREVGEASTQVASAEALLGGQERRIAELGTRRGRLEDDTIRLRVELTEATTRRDQLVDELEGLVERKRISLEQKAEIETTLKTAREGAVQWEKNVDQKRGELHQKRSRLRALEELHARLEGVGQGPRALMATKDPTIVGLVADRFEAPEHLPHAFAAALGDRLQCLVVEDADRGLALLEELRRTNKGRGSIVSRRPAFVAGARPSATGEGVVGRLVDFVTRDPADDALAASLFGDVIVVETADAAVRLRREGELSPIVTLEGTLLGRDGSVAGGTGDRVAEGRLAENREIHQLHDAVAAKSAELEALIAEHDAYRAKMSQLASELDLARSDAHEVELLVVARERDRKSTEERVATTTRRLEAVEREAGEVVSALEKAGEERAAAEAALETGRARKERAEMSLGEADELANTWRLEVTRQQHVVTERKVLLAQVRARAESARQTVDRLGKSCEEMRGRVNRLAVDEIEAAKGAGQCAARMVIEREFLVEAVVEAQRAEDLSKRCRVTLEEARAELASREVDLRRLRQAVEAATDALRAHETTLAKLEIERRHLVEGVREKFRGLELATVVGDYHKRPLVDAAHLARITELGDLIDRMGPVNIDAVREHAEALERHTYYSGQKADLEKALADLEEAILQMNKESKRLFKETFEGINQRFKALFPRMFRGGSAELRLTNPEDMLETGIEILAQPPGKKLSSIELMSGGEKALTAVSLIFAIFQFKPSPFCILDEVDAPLDEANVTRYNEGIRAMTDRSQFILITHIKRTMQSVDVLYGVTMQEPGVSKLVGVKVNDTSAGRSARTSTAAPPNEVAVA